MSGGGIAVGAQLHGIAARRVDVGDRGYLPGGDFVGGVHEIAHATAGADDADAKGVVGAENASGCECGEAAGDDETATINAR